jgi:pantothenate kinase
LRETEGVEIKLRISDFAVAAEIRCCRTRLIATGGAYIIIDRMASALIARE